MQFKVKHRNEVLPSEITPQGLYLDRRRFLRWGAGSAVAAAAFSSGVWNKTAWASVKLPNVTKGPYNAKDELTPYESVTTYNNFYEFGTDKEDPSRLAGSLRPRPWKVVIDGEVSKPGTYDIDELIRPHALQERIYRLRCVEAWSFCLEFYS